jgi:hypothetical protein
MGNTAGIYPWLTEVPERAKIDRLLARYAEVRLVVDSTLQPGDRQALSKLVEAAAWIDRIYWRQRFADDPLLNTFLSSLARTEDSHLQRLVRLNFGPWDSFDNDRAFWERSRSLQQETSTPPARTQMNSTGIWKVSKIIPRRRPRCSAIPRSSGAMASV